jgi:hypothetical protein
MVKFSIGEVQCMSQGLVCGLGQVGLCRALCEVVYEVLWLLQAALYVLRNTLTINKKVYVYYLGFGCVLRTFF